MRLMWISPTLKMLLSVTNPPRVKKEALNYRYTSLYLSIERSEPMRELYSWLTIANHSYEIVNNVKHRVKKKT